LWSLTVSCHAWGHSQVSPALRFLFGYRLSTQQLIEPGVSLYSNLSYFYTLCKANVSIP
jgi:hypothetical protein